MTSGRLRFASAAVACLCLVACIASCSGPDDPDAGASVEAEEEACLSDLSSPTATYEVKTADSAASSRFLTADAAIVQVGEADPQPHVLGNNPRLQMGLDGSRVWAVTENGFLVEPPVTAPVPATRLSTIDGDGDTVLPGPVFGEISRVQVIGDQFLVDDDGDVSAHDVDTGAEVDQQYVEPATTLLSLASSIILVGGGRNGGVADARSDDRFALDNLIVLDVTGKVEVAGSGADQVLLETHRDHRLQYWTWSAEEGVRQVYNSADQVRDNGRPGVCDEFIYVANGPELDVIDTSDDNAVVSRCSLSVDPTAGDSYYVLAIHGGVLVEETDTSNGSTRYTWFDE